MNQTIIVTGGAGFIGANFVLAWVKQGLGTVVNLDKLTYAGNLENLVEIQQNPQHVFVQDVYKRQYRFRLRAKRHF